MIQIDDLILNCDVHDVLLELRNQLNINKINLLKDIKDSGKDIMITCPYHKDGQERRPSSGVRKDDGLFHCFTCNIVKTLPELISNCFGYDDYGVYGTQWLAKNFSTISVENRKEIKLDFKRLNSDVDTGCNSTSKFISEEELDKYRYIHPYMYKRKLTDNIIDIFDIGYDKETDCVTFPIRDIKGNVLAIARRSTKGKYFNYPSGFEKPVYGLYELENTVQALVIVNNGNVKVENVSKDEVIICESMLDALTCWVYGKYAVALNGLGTELQFKQLRELSCRKLILATDNDEAGMKARKRIRDNIKNKIITEYILPEGRKDINELSKEEFGNLQEVF